jgi:epoxyqueuosine reductase
LLRNACVAAGNWGNETAVPTLIDLLTDEEPLIRGHAAWALHQIGTGAAKTALNRAFAYEQGAQVKQELADYK